ncbi:glycosyltransferase family 4 protein [uncultured Hoeflea sp.]|uniref:glycosyltransferase family 4 protein n=1 Tax=uncultured Hoeflea sp. TaxID=538666 RepID=UPI00261F0917|nr:glycosyltransferase family 4 protein [uncultured Hoeflea sp.]
MNIMYLDSIGPKGGASRSLYEMTREISMVPGFDLYFCCTRGTANEYYMKVCKDIVTCKGMFKFDNTRYSYYRGVRWIVLLREILYVPANIYALFKAWRRFPDVDVIHSNEIIEIFTAVIAKKIFGAKLVIHVRSPQRSGVRSLRLTLVRYLLNRYADKVVAIDMNVASTLDGVNNVAVVNNSFSWVDDVYEPDPDAAAKFDEIESGRRVFGFVGNIHKSKGIVELIEACNIMKGRSGNFHLAIIGGETIQLNGIVKNILNRFGLLQNFGDQIRENISKYSLEDRVQLMGQTDNIVSVYKRIDVICFASQLDTPGRPVFEAAFGGVPAILAASRTFPDTAVPGETCLVVDGANPAAIADAMQYFVENPDEVERMGRNARQLALANFDPKKNARKIIDIYECLHRGVRA